MVFKLCFNISLPTVHVRVGMQAGEADAGTFARPEICPAEPNSRVSRHQRRYSGAALWRSLLPNRHHGAHSVKPQTKPCASRHQRCPGRSRCGAVSCRNTW